MTEEEKYSFGFGLICRVITRLIQSLEEEVYSYVPLVLNCDSRTQRPFTVRSGHLSVVAMRCCRSMEWLLGSLSLLDTSSVKVGDRVASLVDGNWIETVVTDRQKDTFSVVDADTSSGAALPVVVNQTQMIRLPQSLGLAKLDVRTYAIAVGSKVLALWPSSTTYYEAVVEARESVQVQVENGSVVYRIG